MKVTRERKIIGAVLVIALVGLGYDQLGGGAVDEAALVDSDNSQLLLAATSKSSNKSNANGANATDGISLATRLATLAGHRAEPSREQMRDAFRPVEGWFTKPTAANATADNTTPTISSAERFVSSHKLTATSLNTGGGGVAVVDGTLVYVGGSIDGYRLRSVTHSSALFESSDGAVAQLKLPVVTSPVTPMSSAATR
jgi:hypothetical protein